ncbi:uncharacterized protein LOC117105451 isoform X2 [Anneissia japonica]|uniref:uncharacterized protein LOC117105451 isoform X2 n=1 Tax=Anneissia japonica TaxID=1529436 RepID=UPI0014257435|nr:uncharacterized protein LOC117105451 isoform X2 [Anneissia japonica]
MDSLKVMGTSGSFLQKNTQDITQRTNNMPTQTVSKIEVKPESDVTRPDSTVRSHSGVIVLANLKPSEASIKTEDVSQSQYKNNEGLISPTEKDKKLPRRQKYVNNRTSRLYELTIPFQKIKVEPEDQEVMNDLKSAIATAFKFLKDAETIVSDHILECLNVCKLSYCDARVRPYRQIIGNHLCDLGYPALFHKLLIELQKLDLFNDENKLAVDIFRSTKSIAWNFTNVSRDLCIELGKAGVIPLLLSSLTQKEFLPSTITESNSFHIKGNLGILSNMIRLSPDNRQIAREHGAVKLLLDYSKVEFIMLQAKCFIILSFLIRTDAEVGLLESTGSVIRFIISLLNTSLASDSGSARGFGTSEILLALNNLALNDKNKVKVVEYGGLTQLAKALQLQTQDNKEAVQILSAELTWKLSFIEDNRQKIKTENGLIDALAILKTSANGKLKTACSGALWETFEGIFEEEDNTPTDVQTTSLKNGLHVMISYQWDVQARIIQLKEKLQNAGYNVWMDIDQMEATYAYKQNKPIIPLLVQPNYTADGWLGALIGTLKYYPFFKDTMVTTEFPKIRNEIGERGKVNSQCKDFSVSEIQDGNTDKARTDSIDGGQRAVSGGGNIPNEVSAWTTKHVSEWLKRIKMTELCNVMKQVNGKLLIQMLKMSNKAPDFFYSRLERDFKMNLMQILKFSSAIDELLD